MKQLKQRPVIVIGSAQANAYRGSAYSYCSCLTSAMGMGGGTDSDDDLFL